MAQTEIYQLNDFQLTQLILSTSGLNPILALLDIAPEDDAELKEKLNRYSADMEALISIGLLQDVSESMAERIENTRMQVGRGYRALVPTKEALRMFKDADDRTIQ
jgi:hypothetical protein